MSSKRKKIVDRLLNYLAIFGVTVVPIMYIVGTAIMCSKIASLEQQMKQLTTAVQSYEDDSTQEPSEESPTTIVLPDPEEPTPIIPVADGEEELLVRLVIAESGNQPYEGQVAVAQVVCDRYIAGYGDSITDVIYAENQFAEPYSKDINDYPLASEAVYAVLYEGERAFVETTIFFCNPDKSNASALAWMRTKSYIGTIADHEFYGE